MFDLDGRGKAISSLSFLSPLELGLLQPVRRSEELFFVFDPERLFKKKEWLLKYLGRFC